MKKILSMALSFALLLNTFTSIVSADEFEMMERLHLVSGVAIPQNLQGLREKPERHTTVIEKEAMLDEALKEQEVEL